MLPIFNPFSIAKLPRIIFESGAVQQLPSITTRFGKIVLVVTGKNSFVKSIAWKELQESFETHKIQYHHCIIKAEPSPDIIDDYVKTYANEKISCVIGIGGGSVLDAAKAIAGLLRVERSVMDYLEGVGSELAYVGPAVPFLAVPTTAGTGSEATKNAVLSRHGEEGFKKSFRDEKLVAEYAIVDPELLSTCTPEIIAANGMDALTQLIESYVSTKSNAFCDALAVSGLQAIKDGLLPWYTAKDEDLAIYQQKMAYAALISGITLAQVGLGSVHGLASPLGAFFPIPHGVVCGTLVAEAAQLNIQAMKDREPDNIGLVKYTRVAEILCQKHFTSHTEAQAALVSCLHEWTEILQLPRLSSFGVTKADIDHLVQHSRGSSMKTNPIVLTDEEISQLLLSRF